MKRTDHVMRTRGNTFTITGAKVNEAYILKAVSESRQKHRGTQTIKIKLNSSN